MPSSEVTILPGLRQGAVSVPPSKSHLHRLMIAEFLAGGSDSSYATADAASDVLATQACLEALRRDSTPPCLDCRESGSTLRFLLPVAMACRDEALFTAEGRLPQRPVAPFLELLADHGVQCLSDVFPLHLRGALQPGKFLLPGNISSQMVTGLLFALPLLDAESRIRLTSPLESRGYVEMTLQLLRAFQIEIAETPEGFRVPGGQRYRRPPAIVPELDWSGAAFWMAMNRLGSRIAIPDLPADSRQPDRQITGLLARLGTTIDVAQCPDCFPVLAVAAAALPTATVFTGTRRLRLKESDRLAAMAELLKRLGVPTDNEEERFVVHGIGTPLHGNITVEPQNDHRIAMAAAVAATIADAPVTILHPHCVQKSYPDFFRQFQKLDVMGNNVCKH